MLRMYMQIREPMLTGTQLLKRWCGIFPKEFARCIDERNNITSPGSPDPSFFDFPEAFILRGAVKDENGQIIYYCSECTSTFGKFGKEYSPPYKVSGEGYSRIYDFSMLAFRLREVEVYEKYSPSLFYTLIDPEEVEIPSTDVQLQSKAWEDVLPKLKRAELTAAKLAIQKLQGKTHKEAFQAVRPNGNDNDSTNYVSKKRAKAEKVAKEYNLHMPQWASEK